MRHLTLAEALTIAEVVTGIPAETLAKAGRIELLDSALHAPQARFGDTDLYPEIVDKAAVLVVRLAGNHPLPDGNKRLAWQSLTMFLAINGYDLEVPTDEAVSTMLAIASGEMNEETVAEWLGDRISSRHRSTKSLPPS